MSLAYLYYEYDYINFLQIVCLSNYKSLFFFLLFFSKCTQWLGMNYIENLKNYSLCIWLVYDEKNNSYLHSIYSNYIFFIIDNDWNLEVPVNLVIKKLSLKKYDFLFHIPVP